MGRKIILLSDGTGNSSATVWRTNVWRVFESIDLAGDNQVAFYDDGVGTASFKPIAILGGAFGYGLKRNVIDIYKFACRNHHNSDDAIFGFGFSRGAFTMRVVTGLILDQGLVQASSEPELHAKAIQAYRAYRRRYHTIWPTLLRPEEWGRALRSLFTRERHYSKNENKQISAIRFLGLWDTVAAYGLPIDEMTRGVSKFLWPMMLPDCGLDPKVARACHALSLDDERRTFHPVLWDERDEPSLQADADGHFLLHNERISQVWFSGMHANVGGGYPDDTLAHVPLTWIMNEAKLAGLVFKTALDANPQTIAHPLTVRDKDGRIYDSRAGLGSYYRYGPRDVLALSLNLIRRKGQTSAVPRIHQSVFDRIKNQAHAYAPLAIPQHYEVVTTDGKVLSGASAGYETDLMARARLQRQQRAWGQVFTRKLLYLLTVIVSLYLLALPITTDRVAEDEFTSSIGWISDGLTFLRRVLPAAFDPWISVFAQHSWTFAFCVAALYILTKASGIWAAKIQTAMQVAWLRSLRGTLQDDRTSISKKSGIGGRIFAAARNFSKNWLWPTGYALLFALLGLAILNRASFEIQNYAGLVCRETGTKNELAQGEFVTEGGRSLEMRPFAERAKNDPKIVREADKRNPFFYLPRYGVQLPTFQTSSPCQSMGVIVERPGTYVVRFESTDTFADYRGRVVAPYGYFPTALVKQKVGHRILPEGHMSAISIAKSVFWAPFKREVTHPYFRVFARVGGTGGEVHVLEPDPFETTNKINVPVKVQHRGELFLYVNDAISGVPLMDQSAYRNNVGSTRVLILRQ